MRETAMAAISIDPTALQHIGSLPLRARIIADATLAGLHRSRTHGSSIEFAQHKQYAPGDDLRHIDWRGYARMDRHMVKQFEREGQLTAYCVLDATASMAYQSGLQSKLEYAAHLCASLTHLLIRQHDLVGLVSYGDAEVNHRIPATGRPRHLHELLSILESVVARRGRGDDTCIAALDRVAALARRRRCLIVVLSDLFEPSDPLLSSVRGLKARGHDVAIFHILDPDELAFPFRGLTKFESPETGHTRLVNSNSVRKQYRQRMQSFLENTRKAYTAIGTDYVACDTRRPFNDVLRGFLLGRHQRSAREPATSWSL